MQISFVIIYLSLFLHLIIITPLQNFTKYVLSFLLILCFNAVFAQKTKISGVVYDASNSDPLPFVSVAFKNSTIGVSTDIEGRFTIEAIEYFDSLVISYLGYKKQTIAVKKIAYQEFKIKLEPDLLQLNEVLILSGENPAITILKSIIKNKNSNDRDKYQAFEYEVYNKIEFDLNNLPDQYPDRRMLKKMDFIFDYVDSSKTGEKPSLPIFISETLSDFFVRRNPKNKKEVIKASKISGIEDNNVSLLLGDMYQNINIYDNNLLVFGKNFVSPVSDNGQFYYKYYLTDSMDIEGHKCFQIQFKPKRSNELTFEGVMWIADTSFAMSRFDMRISENANINYVRNLHVIQEFTDTAQGFWILQKDRLLIDFAFSDKKVGFYGRKTSSYKNIIVNQPKTEEFFKRFDNIQIDESAIKKDDAFWAIARHDTLSKSESNAYKLVDSVQNMKLYKSWVDLVQIFVTGYKTIGPIDYGPYFTLFSKNAIEGVRLRVGGRTSDAFSKYQEWSAYTAYGFLDKTWKYKIGYKAFVSKIPRQIFYIDYKKDVEVLGQSSNAFRQDNILATLFRRNPLTKLTMVKQASIGYEYEPFDGLNFKAFIVNREMLPLGTTEYKRFNDAGNIVQIQNITTTELRLITRFAYDEKYLKGSFSRVSLGTKYPVITLNYSKGIKALLGGDYNYHKIAINVSDRFRLNPFGYTDYIIEAGKIFGTVPFPLLELHGGNETLIFDMYAFNMMNYFEFASDKYFTAQFFHHFDGFFFNKFPLLKKLKWREVLTFKTLYGATNAENKSQMILPSTLSSFGKLPYSEIGAGVENIFKIFRIDFLWRLTYSNQDYINNYKANNPTSTLSVFGIRASMQVIF